MIKYSIYSSSGKLIDTVRYNKKFTIESVKRQLILIEGFSPDIIVTITG